MPPNAKYQIVLMLFHMIGIFLEVLSGGLSLKLEVEMVCENSNAI
jgi:hypothetical protein